MCRFQLERDRHYPTPGTMPMIISMFDLWRKSFLPPPFRPHEECQLFCRFLLWGWCDPALNPGSREGARWQENCVCLLPLHSSPYLFEVIEHVMELMRVELKRLRDLYSAAVEQIINHFSYFSCKNAAHCVVVSFSNGRICFVRMERSRKWGLTLRSFT